MRKHLIPAVIMSLFCFNAVQAQDPIEYGFFDHLSVGVSVGTDGVGFDVAMPVSHWAALRVGLSMIPEIKYSRSVDISEFRKDTKEITADEIVFEAKPNEGLNYKILVDFYPFKKSSFHLTGGAYFASTPRFVTAYNTEPFMEEDNWGRTGVKVGDYKFVTDENGIITANLESNTVKPYVGLGFGRAVPHKRVNVAFELGARFWGEPGVCINTLDKWGDIEYTKLTKEGLNKKDADQAFDIMSKVIAYPVLSLRINGRIF